MSSLNHFCSTNVQKIWYSGAFVYNCIYVYVCIYYTSGGRIYINVRRRGKYANLISDTIIFFCTRRRRRRRCCADEFARKPARIICLSLSENGKLPVSRRGRRGTVHATFFIFSPAFIIYFFYSRAMVGGVNDVDEREGRYICQRIPFQPPRHHATRT